MRLHILLLEELFLEYSYMKLNLRLKIYTQTTSWVYSHSFVECDYVKGNVPVKTVCSD
jgi:hypothetical protein